MALSAAEKNKRKCERKKRERAEQQQQQEHAKEEERGGGANFDVEIEYVAEPIQFFDGDGDDTNNDESMKGSNEAALPAPNANAENEGDGNNNEQDLRAVMRRFQNRAAVVVGAAYVSDDEGAINNKQQQQQLDSNTTTDDNNDDDVNDVDEFASNNLSKRKLKDILRPTLAQLKQRVAHPELVEAHDYRASSGLFNLPKAEDDEADELGKTVSQNRVDAMPYLQIRHTVKNRN